jgi:hypothetical protein
MFPVDIKDERLFNDGNAEELDLMKASSVATKSASVILNRLLVTAKRSIRTTGKNISQSVAQQFLFIRIKFFLINACS